MGQAYWDPEIFGLQKRRQRPDITIVVDLGAKPHLKQTNKYLFSYCKSHIWAAAW